MAKRIFEYENWTDFSWQDKVINAVFRVVRLIQGKIIGQMNALGFSAKEETTFSSLTLTIVKSSEIEGELLNYDQVRSSIARRLGINIAELVQARLSSEVWHKIKKGVIFHSFVISRSACTRIEQKFTHRLILSLTPRPLLTAINKGFGATSV